jgi:hypothetical protein
MIQPIIVGFFLNPGGFLKIKKKKKKNVAGS